MDRRRNSAGSIPPLLLAGLLIAAYIFFMEPV